MKNKHGWLLLAGVLLLACGAARAQDSAKTSLWIDARKIDLSDANVMKQVVKQPVERLIVPCFDGGETIYPTQSKLFNQMPMYRGKDDALQSLIERAHANKMKVYGFVDCLHWSEPGTPAAQSVLNRHPALAARDLKGSCGTPSGGKYASPFNAEVRAALKDVVGEIAARYPQLDGLLLQCRLSLGTLLGYSEAVRAAYIRDKNLDPIDLQLSGSPAELKLTGEWVQWRAAQVTQLVKELGAEFKAKNPRGQVAALGYANWYHLSAGQRNTSLEDWFSWAVSGAVGEVVLQADGNDASNSAALSYAATLARKTGKPIQLSVLLPLRDGNDATDPKLAVPTGMDLVLRVERVADLSRVQARREVDPHRSTLATP